MNSVDFVDLAIYCQNIYKDLHKSENDYYVGTLFIAITEEGVLTSRTPHILSKAQQYILIHERRTLAVSNYYSWYSIEFIDSNGCVSDGKLDDEFFISIIPFNGFGNQILELAANGQTYYRCKGPWESHIVKVWKLYLRLKDAKTERERILIADLFAKDEQILEMEKTIEDFKFTNRLLEQERNQYKSLLNEIKELVTNE